MNRLSVLLGRPETEVTAAVTKLEEISGSPSEDVRTLAESTQSLRAKVASLGLDPDDTTGEELYHALLSKYHTDAGRVDKALGVTGRTDLATRIAKAGGLVAHSMEPNQVWGLKNSVAKDLIRQNPPKKLLKKLNYRSVDSLIKREDIAAIFIMADKIELPTWHKRFTGSLSKLSSSSYELRQVRIASVPVGAPGPDPVLINGAIGATAVNPEAVRHDTPVLTLALSLLDGLQALSEQPIKHRLHNANPALGWWLGAEHLLSFNDGQPVSLNFKDVAQNHLHNNHYESRNCQAGYQAFWAKLMNRYKDYVDELPQEFVAAEHKIDDALKPAASLVPEPIEVGE